MCKFKYPSAVLCQVKETLYNVFHFSFVLGVNMHLYCIVPDDTPSQIVNEQGFHFISFKADCVMVNRQCYNFTYLIWRPIYENRLLPE